MATDQTTDEQDVEAVEPEVMPEPDRLALHEVPEVQEFIRQQLTPVLVGVGIAVAAFLAWTAYQNYQKTAAQTASAMLFNSQSVDQYQKVVDQYPTTSAGPLALLSLAGKHYDDGQFELAQHVYLQFGEKYPDHDMKPVAELGNAQCLEAMGRFDEALDAYGKFMAAHPDYYLSSVATFGKARCFEQAGKFQDAKAVYEDYLVANPSNNWSSKAESSLLFVNKQMRAQKEGLVPQAQPAPDMSFTPVAPQLSIPASTEPAH